MRSFSRREFFSLNFSNEDSSIISKEKHEIVVGRICDFPPGTQKILSSLSVVVESLPEGFRAQSSKNMQHYYALKENLSGELVLNYLELWPANRVYSFLINGPTDLKITSREDRS